MTNRKRVSDRSDSDICGVVETAVQEQKEFDFHMKQYRSITQDRICMLQLIADSGEFLTAPLNNFLCLLFAWNVGRKISCVVLLLLHKEKNKFGKRDSNIHRRIQRKLKLNI
jgi:hypothetical protein